MRRIEHWIDGGRTSGQSGRSGPVYDPATGAVTGSVTLAEVADVDAAVTAATKAAAAWRERSPSARARVMFALRALLNERIDDLAALITAEHGKTLADARGEVQRGIEVVEFACGIPHLLKGEYSDGVATGVDAWSMREPLGVVAGITPFNFPVMVPLWMHPIAIAAGNAFVLKPSEQDPSPSVAIAELYAEAGLPPGVLNVVHGDRSAVEAILDHPGIAAVSFVGSTPVARLIHQRASAAGKRVQALGGAKNHAVVLPDADLDLAAAELTGAAYGSAGQRCMAVSVVVAVGEAADPLVSRLADRARAIRVGAGSDPASEMGPLINEAALVRVRTHLTGAQQAGAEVVVDGREAPHPGEGFFVGPSLVDHVSTDADLYTAEVFGPVLAVVRVDTAQAALDLVNANPYGNGVAVFTGSGAAARWFSRGVQVGMVGINVPIPVPMAFHSFGGWKDSLFGDTHMHGTEGVRFYTRAKAVTARWPQDSIARTGLHFPAER
ncbi:MAG TPA: CoA-acylating methylmalonate-semialdehyde dehydrogenase [Sporichthyaceae bacterium]|nr:CoA-acylating methylmalonate-semialdehyde dehydrogenase [Sporichthyaceae bacterium]